MTNQINKNILLNKLLILFKFFCAIFLKFFKNIFVKTMTTRACYGRHKGTRFFYERVFYIKL